MRGPFLIFLVPLVSQFMERSESVVGGQSPRTELPGGKRLGVGLVRDPIQEIFYPLRRTCSLQSLGKITAAEVLCTMSGAQNDVDIPSAVPGPEACGFDE